MIFLNEFISYNLSSLRSLKIAHCQPHACTLISRRHSKPYNNVWAKDVWARPVSPSAETRVNSWSVDSFWAPQIIVVEGVNFKGVSSGRCQKAGQVRLANRYSDRLSLFKCSLLFKRILRKKKKPAFKAGGETRAEWRRMTNDVRTT